MPLQATSGAASYDAFGGGVAAVPNYIEDVFSTWLYTGNGTTQTITNGIDLAGKGGMVWIKSRSNATSNTVFDTVRGATKFVTTDTTNNQDTISDTLTAFNSTGFTLGSDALDGKVNTSPRTYVSWTFRKQPKFFDVVTYTGTGSNRTIAHNLGSAPGCVIIKCTSQAYVWAVYHRGMTSAAFAMQLQATDAQSSEPTYFNSTAPTSTVFSVGTANATNQSGQTYVAYLFAHNAGGFGLTGTDNVITCGSFTTDGSGNATVNLGYEPQWVLYKPSTAINNWKIFDNMRGMVVGSGDQALYPNTSGAEVQDDSIQPAATGFSVVGGDASATHIYIAIRRGPMRTPTSGTSVFAPAFYNGDVTNNRLINTGLLTDAVFVRNTNNTITGSFRVASRLTGDQYLQTSATSAEATNATAFMTPTSGVGNSFSAMNGFGVGTNTTAFLNNSTNNIAEAFRRAPSVFDVVCYTGTGSATNISHNLGAVPELMIVKQRSNSNPWNVYAASLGNNTLLVLNTTAASSSAVGRWNFTTPTSAVFTVGSNGEVNGSGNTYVAYLFASCPGVSKVFNYTGNGSSQTINCGFTGGARFVMIKRTDSTGDWYVWDTARGIVANNDPHLSLNTTAAEVTTNDTIDTDSTGFVVNQISATNVNVNGASYIGLAIA